MKASGITNIMGAMGRNGDTMMAHVTPGDVVIPRDVVLGNPEFLTKFKKAMQDMGGDYRTHVAGSGYENYNPDTGAPEFFFSGIKNFAKKIFSNPISTLGVLAAPFTGGASLLLSAPTAIMDSPRKMAAEMAGAGAPGALPAPDLGAVTEEFTPTRPEAPELPTGLATREAGGQEFGTLSPTQQRSYLATEGAFGGGVGDEARQYYLNLLQRNLIDEGGQLQNINTALLPVERTYLSRLGLPTDDTSAFYQALQG